MRMEQLRCLVDIAQTGSLTSTAQRLYMTQPAVSQRIKQLEQDLGVELLVRTKSGTELTAVGEQMVNYAKQILEIEQEMMHISKQHTMQLDSSVEMKICSTSSVAEIVLPDIIAKQSVHRKKLSFKIQQANDIGELMQQVQSGQCNFGMMTYNEQKIQDVLKQYEGLQLSTLALDELVVVTDRKYVKEEMEYFPMELYFPLELYKNPVTTLYNIMAIDEIRDVTLQKNIVASNNADFHRRMIEKAGAIVAMPGLAYQYFFNAKRYIGLPLENIKVPLIHAAIYRSDADEQVQSIIAMIRRELMQKQMN